MAALSREQVTKLVSDALVRSLEGQPFKLDAVQPTAAPAPPAAAPAPGPSGGTLNDASGQVAASTSLPSAAMGASPRPAPARTPAAAARTPATGAGTFDAAMTSQGAASTSSRVTGLGGATDDLRALYESDCRLLGIRPRDSAPSDRRQREPSPPMRSLFYSRSSAMHPFLWEDCAGHRVEVPPRPTETGVARPSIGFQRRSAPAHASVASKSLAAATAMVSDNEDEDETPCASSSKDASASTSRRVAPSQRERAPRWKGAIPTTKATSSEAVWLSAARHWTEGGDGLPGPLKNYRRPLDPRSRLVFERRKIVGREFERLGCSVSAFERTYAAAGRLSLGQMCTKIEALADYSR